MACASVPDTALQEYAKLVRQRALPKTPAKFPMYTVHTDHLLLMTEVRPHEMLLADGVLTVFEESKGKAMFVSHQWIGHHHPDPEAKQFRVLQDTLRNLMDGSCKIGLDVDTEFKYGSTVKISTDDFRSQPLYVWYDYFSCPQLEGTKLSAHKGGQLQEAIDSIPSYVEQCSVFAVLCPTVTGIEGSQVFNYFTWQARGWCRLELIARQLSISPMTEVLLIQDSTQPEATRGRQVMVSAAGEGDFSVAMDRIKVGPMLQGMFKTKLLWHLQRGEVEDYRILLSRERSIFRGLPLDPVDPLVDLGRVPIDSESDPAVLRETFLQQYGFRNVKEKGGLGSPLCYACIHGDAGVVKALLEAQANPSEKVQKVVVGLTNAVGLGVPVLALAARYRNLEVMKVLIQAKADLNNKPAPGALIQTPLALACGTDYVEGIQLLLEARADPYIKDLFTLDAFTLAVATDSLQAVDFMLSAVQDLQICTLFYPMTHPATAERLINAKADVNQRHKLPLVARIAMDALGFQNQLKTHKTRMGRFGYHWRECTPLLYQIIFRNWDVAAALVKAGAKVDLRNSRGKNAKDLALELGAPAFLMEALEGERDGFDDLITRMASTKSVTLAASVTIEDLDGIEVAQDHLSI